MNFVNLNVLNNVKLETVPFENIVIDNFLKEEYIDILLKELDALTIDKSYYHGDQNIENKKYAFNKNLGCFTDSLIKELCGDDFINFIEQKFNIQNIIRNNVSLEGAGIHKTYNKGFLTMHKDFNYSNNTTYGLLDRRINLLLYMNPDWKEEYNGELLLYDDINHRIGKKISPILNRCVIFNTTNAIHGHPVPLNLPTTDSLIKGNDRSRQSLALYYYTKNTTGKSILGENLQPVTWYKNLTGI